ncbi:MAG: hypothetical protein MUC83_16105 [Pirellula sp.]|jgi:hypothetical protein|nr:hypothetical protein [Pirellula sp.]
MNHVKHVTLESFESELASRFSLSSIPTLMFVTNSKVEGRSAGVASGRDLSGVVE